MKSFNLRLAFHVLWLLAAPAGLAAPLALKVVDPAARGVDGTVITLRSTDPARALAPAVKASMDQVDLAFVPQLLVIPSGSTVAFPNSDKVRHQVYSFSEARRFELPLYSGAPYPPVEFGRRGMVTLGCNIHDQMRAYLYVVEAQYFGRTGADGILRQQDVQPGEYVVQVWDPRSRENRPIIDQKINVPAAGGEMTLRLEAPLKRKAVSQVPADWDAY